MIEESVPRRIRSFVLRQGRMTAAQHRALEELLPKYGVPEGARPFGGLVYRQALEHLHGVRDEPATRALIAQENRRYARRQLTWFRKEPDVNWFAGPGESDGTKAAVNALLAKEIGG